MIENVGRRIRPSLQLAGLAMAISLLVATPDRASSPRRSATPRSTASARSFALFGICMPNFLIALLLIFVFGVTLHWLPISGYVDPFEDPGGGLRSLALPAITLGLALAAVITRTLRSSLLEALSEDYVRTARAKGLADGAVVRRHALKNALIPVVTVLGLQFGTPDRRRGDHRVRLRAARASAAWWSTRSSPATIPLVQGVVLLIAVGFIVSNLAVDVLYGWLDPRIRHR